MKQGVFSLSNLIYINKEKLEFHLTNGCISYIFRVMPKIKQLESIYFGKAVHVREDLSNLDEYEPGSGCQLFAQTGIASLEHRRQEYPTYGTTDFRKPAFEIKYDDGDKISNFQYYSYQILNGAPYYDELPHVRYADDDAKTLVILLKDEYSELKLKLNYTIFADLDIIVRNAEFFNPGKNSYHLLSAKSASFDLSTANYDLITLNGAWARERHVNRTPLRPGIQEIGSVRGATGHIHDPFIALADKNTSQNQGNVIGMTLMYSGNHQETIDVNAYGVTRVMTGISDADFDWILEPMSNFVTPQAVLSFSDQGFNGLSHNYHDLIREHILNQHWQKPERPVLINNWEATYYDFDEKKLVNLAKEAKDIGCDLFVLDDGWFGHRTSDAGSMGDWEVDKKKLPQGLDHLVQKIHDLDMKFGLWFEPEALSMDTKLYQEHPSWLLGNSKKHLSQGRNQYLVDFTNPAAVNFLFKKISKIIDQIHPDYIKWDMNRNITEPYSNYLPKDQQGEVFHRYILGVYKLYQLLTDKYPKILFESCAGGGGRYDLAMFYYAPQAWTSDDTDANERWQIQTGTSYVYPPAVMGAHVSIVPNHQTGRVTPLHSRVNIAMFGTYGYEFDLTKLTQKEKDELKKGTEQFHHFHDLIFNGDFYRLEPSHPGHGTWEVNSKDKKHAVICYYYGLSEPNNGYYHVKLAGLDPNQLYEINGQRKLFGDELMNIGLPLTEDYRGREAEYWSKQRVDFDTKIFELKAIND